MIFIGQMATKDNKTPVYWQGLRGYDKYSGGFPHPIYQKGGR